MIKIAITGNIGTGKSTVAKILKEFGLKVFESDEIVNKILEEKEVLDELKITFGKKIKGLFISQTSLNKKELGNFVFSNKEELCKLESIIHPKINIQKEIFLTKNSNESVLFFDIPLLFEKNMAEKFNFVFYTFVDEKLQKKRVLQRANMNEEKFFNILQNQNKLNKNQQNFISLKINTSLDIEKIKVIIRNFLVDNLNLKI
tara:strand:+ start:753 stop:1358 length:606 start_codon:yes stop_codon:yes gene_type:complete